MSSMAKKFGVFFLAGVFVVSLGGVALAQQGHGHGGMDMSSQGGMSSHGSGGSSHSMSMSMKDRPVLTATVEGFKITLDVMTAEEHMKMAKAHGAHQGGTEHAKSHHFVVTVQDTASKEIISDAKVMFAVQSPSGEKQTGKLNWVGDHYGGDIDLKGKEDYGVSVMIESGGMEREAKFTYKL